MNYNKLYPILTLAKINVPEMVKFANKTEVVDFIKKNPGKMYVLRTDNDVFVSNTEDNKDLISHLETTNSDEYYLQPRVNGLKVNILSYFNKTFHNPILCYEGRGMYLLIPLERKDFRLYTLTLGRLEDKLPSTTKGMVGLKVIITQDDKCYVVDCFDLLKELMNFKTMFLDEKKMSRIVGVHKILKRLQWI